LLGRGLGHFVALLFDCERLVRFVRVVESALLRVRHSRRRSLQLTRTIHRICTSPKTGARQVFASADGPFVQSGAARRILRARHTNHNKAVEFYDGSRWLCFTSSQKKCIKAFLSQQQNTQQHVW
jgi:hypothetical protein